MSEYIVVTVALKYSGGAWTIAGELTFANARLGVTVYTLPLGGSMLSARQYVGRCRGQPALRVAYKASFDRPVGGAPALLSEVVGRGLA